MTDYAPDIHRFIVDNFLFGREDEPLTFGESLLERGVIDSTGVLELVGFLETNYHITVADEELVPAHLDSIERISAFVAYKLQPVAKRA